MKNLLIISSLFLFAYNSSAQQQYVFTNFMMNDYYYNPAVAGSKNVHFANVGFRAQWAGFNEAPRSIYANFYGSANNKMKHGYGISIMNDRSGLVSNTGILLNYAYHVKLSDKFKLGLGIKPGYQQYNIKLYDAKLADDVDVILNGNVLSTGAFDMQSGLHLYSDKLFVMLSMRHMFGKAIKFTGFNDGLAKHYTAIAGYKWIVNKKKPVTTTGGEEGVKTDSTANPNNVDLDPKKPKKDFELMPVIMLNYVSPITPQGSIMIRATYDHKYWAGVSYRSQSATDFNFGTASLGLSLGVVIKKRFHLGYAFDYTMGNLQSYNSGSHEFMLSFQTTSKKKTLDEEDEELNNSIFDENKSKKKKE